MLLAFRALLVLGLVSSLHGTSGGQRVSVKLGPGIKQKNRTVKLILDNTVQLHTASMSAAPIANMSLSPWTYSDSCVESRMPSRISNAHCLTSGCMRLDGGGEDMTLEAKPIYYQILVLHRVRRQNKTGRTAAGRKYAFRLGTETVVVGCTCVRPSVVPQR